MANNNITLCIHTHVDSAIANNCLEISYHNVFGTQHIMSSLLQTLLIFFCSIRVPLASCVQHKYSDQCPLWHIHNSNGECVCGASLSGVITCDKDSIYIENGYCLTWNNLTKMKNYIAVY